MEGSYGEVETLLGKLVEVDSLKRLRAMCVERDAQVLGG